MVERVAERLWRAERQNDSPMNIAAMCYLCMASGMSGHEILAFQLRDDIRGMGTRIGLFGTRPSHEATTMLHQLPPDEFKARAAAAWGAYGWLT